MINKFKKILNQLPTYRYLNNISILLIFLILGFVMATGLVVGVESKAEKLKTQTPAAHRIEKIKEEIKKYEIENTLLESEILILNHVLTQMFEVKEKEEIIKLSKFTGTQVKVGQGIVISLLENDKPLKIGENPNLGVIHNFDLLKIVNELWKAKSEAISINNQRITSFTGISCIGPTILINKARIVPPFVIKAIGNPKALSEAVNNGHIKTLELYGIQNSIEKHNSVEISSNSNIILAGEIYE